MCLEVWNKFNFFFKMWTIFFKSLLNLLQYCFCFYVLVFWPQGMWDFSSPTRDRTCTPRVGRQSFNHWTAREIPQYFIIKPIYRSSSLTQYFFLFSNTPNHWTVKVATCLQRRLMVVLYSAERRDEWYQCGGELRWAKHSSLERRTWPSALGLDGHLWGCLSTH